jgi:hypothetical protein
MQENRLAVIMLARRISQMREKAGHQLFCPDYQEKRIAKDQHSLSFLDLT